LGRVFVVAFGVDDEFAEALEKFAAERGIGVAQVLVTTDRTLSGIIAPGDDGKPALTFAGESPAEGVVGEAVIQEVLGVKLQRETGGDPGFPRLRPVSGSVARVMEKAAPSPRAEGPATVPIYLFNAELN
jgi:hypothetical protein